MTSANVDPAEWKMPKPSEQALMDQTNALIDEICRSIQEHWSLCKLSPDFCVGSKATDLILSYAQGGPSNTKAMVFLAMIRMARHQAQAAGR